MSHFGSSHIRYPSIHDYGIIGDCRTAALISRDGSIDWLCLPRFDGPSFFNRLLDWDGGGYCAIRPNGHFTVRRSYRENTAILETDFLTDEGVVRVTDLMPVLPDEDRQARLLPFRHILRRIEGLEGAVAVDLVVKLRPDDGRLVPVFHPRRHVGFAADLGNRVFLVATDAPMRINAGELRGTVTVARGRTISLWMAYSEEGPAVYPCITEAARALEETAEYWSGWIRRCSYTGPHRQNVVRSAITLKLLTYAPSGAIVAAPTTSLPERIGGDLNWDYRYCWLRDASWTAQIFLRLGFESEATAFIQWLAHATTLTYPDLQVMYDVHGEASLSERMIPTFEGYRRSRPVRVGNAASGQFQLDLYGEVLGALYSFVEGGHRLDRDTQRWMVRMGDSVSERWSRPDQGIWEFRNAPRHYVHSKVQCWLALDRAERLVRRLGLPESKTNAWREAREAIGHAVLTSGYSHTRHSFVQVLGEDRLDASALTFSGTGFVAGQHPMMSSTIAAIQRELGHGALLYRYLPEESGQEEGAFLACSFWLVDALTLAGRRDEAERMIDLLQDAANDVGLYSEEMREGTPLGNFPLALTHVAHLTALVRLYAQDEVKNA